MDTNLPRIERKVGNRRYRATILPLQEWFHLEELVGVALGGPLEDFFKGLPAGAFKGGFNIGDLQTETLAEVLGGIIHGLNADRFSDLVDYLGKTLECQDKDGKWVRIDKPQGHFRMYIRDLIPVLVLFLEANFADFFAGALDALGREE